jgi:hypothetical protein
MSSRQNNLQFEVQALRQRWPIDERTRRAIIGALLTVLKDDAASYRDKNAAIRGLLTAEAQNQKDEHTAALQSDRNRFLEVAQQLGIDADFRLAGQEPAGANHVGTDGPERFDEATVERYRAEADDEEQGG